MKVVELCVELVLGTSWKHRLGCEKYDETIELRLLSCVQSKDRSFETKGRTNRRRIYLASLTFSTEDYPFLRLFGNIVWAMKNMIILLNEAYRVVLDTSS